MNQRDTPLTLEAVYTLYEGEVSKDPSTPTLVFETSDNELLKTCRALTEEQDVPLIRL